MTYTDCSSDIGSFTRYIDILENQYSVRTLNFESNDIMYKEEVNYNNHDDKLKFKGKSEV